MAMVSLAAVGGDHHVVEASGRMHSTRCARADRRWIERGLVHDDMLGRASGRGDRSSEEGLGRRKVACPGGCGCYPLPRARPAPALSAAPAPAKLAFGALSLWADPAQHSTTSRIRRGDRTWRFRVEVACQQARLFRAEMRSMPRVGSSE